jgi:hypothetical protein
LDSEVSGGIGNVFIVRKHRQAADDVDRQLPGAVIDGVSFVDCVFRGVRSSEVVEASGSILFRNVKIEPAEKGRSLNSRSTWVSRYQ